MSKLEPLAACLPPRMRVDEQTPVIYWLTDHHPRILTWVWVPSETHRSTGSYCTPPVKPISRCFHPRG